MPEPWFDPGIFAALCGGVGGGLLGALVGTAGGVGGDLARKGRRPAWVRVVLSAVLVAGAVLLAAGILAWAVGQPPGIWTSLAGMGVLWGIVSIGTSRKLRELYENASKEFAAEPNAAADGGRDAGLSE